MATTQIDAKAHALPLLKRWQIAIDSCNAPDIHSTDTLTRWLVISRACVFSMTLTSSLIGVLLAASLDAFTERPLLKVWFAFLVVIGLLAAHASNNLVNDWTDVKRGVDTEDYPRAQYSPHPVLGGLTTPGTLLRVALGLTALDSVIMLYLAAMGRPWVIAFGVSGLALSLGYTVFLKRFALGELTALTVWGPLMIGGAVYAISGTLTWDAVLTAVPYGLIVASVLIGKHTDKITNDAPIGVHSIPVIVGEQRALIFNKAMFVLFYALVVGLVVSGVSGPWILLSFLAVPRLLTAWKIYSQPRPAAKPENWPVWPLWYVGWALYFNREAGKWFILGLLLNLLVPAFIGVLG
jgi:1,4-dihydroxy-2-naphthoate octaprenyltransferase